LFSASPSVLSDYLEPGFRNPERHCRELLLESHFTLGLLKNLLSKNYANALVLSPNNFASSRSMLHFQYQRKLFRNALLRFDLKRSASGRKITNGANNGAGLKDNRARF
jgi:hypothetical protein